MQELQTLHEQFIKFQNAGGRSRITIKNYRENFELLLKFMPDMELKDLTEKNMVDFFEYLNTRERTVGKEQVVRVYKNSSIATVRGKLNTFFQWLTERKLIKANPFEKIPHPDVSYTDKRAFTSAEFDRICNAINTKIQWVNLLIKKRNIAMIMFLALTGLRKNEMINLTLSDIDMKKKTVNVRAATSKSKQDRIVNLSGELVPYLEDYFKERHDYTTNALWVSNNDDHALSINGMKHLIDQLSETTGINCHLHRFRHTFAVNYYLQTRDIIGLKQILGHKSFKMTVSYLRSISNDPQVQLMQQMVVAEFM